MQIIGTRKSSDTRKAIRYFKERGIEPHVVDLSERPLSRGELENIARSLGAEALIDPECKAFERRGLAYMVYDPLEELARDPLLLKTPVVRFGREATVGVTPETWSRWLAD
ncbi:MAG: glutaredoxin [Spirochaetales bacterium]|nr:glutaredoxin [Spirochaetales bacterium]